MKNLQMIAMDCMNELDEIGIEYGNILEFTINTRAKKRWGQCRKVPSGFTINISEKLLDDSVSDTSTKTTIIHEILHTCKGCFNHGTEWKIQAERVNFAYGYDIKRCTSAEEKGIEREIKPIHYKYGFQCTGCGQKIMRTRKSKFTEHPEAYRCGICKGNFTRILSA